MIFACYQCAVDSSAGAPEWQFNSWLRMARCQALETGCACGAKITWIILWHVETWFSELWGWNDLLHAMFREEQKPCQSLGLLRVSAPCLLRLSPAAQLSMLTRGVTSMMRIPAVFQQKTHWDVRVQIDPIWWKNKDRICSFWYSSTWNHIQGGISSSKKND